MQTSKYNLNPPREGLGTPTLFRFSPIEGNGRSYATSNNGTMNTIYVENIPDNVGWQEVVALFNTLIGEIGSIQNINDTSTKRLELTFLDRDTASKALCMNGYNVAGTPLSVFGPTTTTIGRAIKAQSDDRRNLYVLGLPFALTKNEFSALFAKHGVVSHSVILATVDNSSRRRGFVVMSTHDEAKRAMNAITRTQIKGHTIDVSWAVVQRSQGFLDGGDRTLLLEARSHLSSPSQKYMEQRLPSPDTSEASLTPDVASITTSQAPTTCLLVSGLPTILFSQAQDLHPLFFPFGHIEKLEIVQVSPLGSMSVIVQYSSASIAQEAVENLNGQQYGNYRLEVSYIRPASESPTPSPNVNHHSGEGPDSYPATSRTNSMTYPHERFWPSLRHLNGREAAFPDLNHYNPFSVLSLDRNGKSSDPSVTQNLAPQRPQSGISSPHYNARWLSGQNIGDFAPFSYQNALSTRHLTTLYQSSAA